MVMAVAERMAESGPKREASGIDNHTADSLPAPGSVRRVQVQPSPADGGNCLLHRLQQHIGRVLGVQVGQVVQEQRKAAGDNEGQV